MSEDIDHSFNPDLIIPMRKLKGFSDHDASNLLVTSVVQSAEQKLFAVTVNIKPTKKMNSKYWHKYTHDEQRQILMRVERSFRRYTPSVELIEMHYEICPTLNSVHYHACYKAPAEFKQEIYCHFQKYSGNDKNTKIPWRVIDVEQVDNMIAWMNYMRKDVNKI